ncbi:MAG: uncharacterized protein JWP08_725 [Bryobacterales bacterium]|nr:uncharacterized protein [Bryobacterales bacterium]
MRRTCSRTLFLATVLLAGYLAAGAEEPEVGRFDSMIQAGQYADAQSALENYVAAHPDSWRAQYQLGYVYFRLQKIQPSLVSVCKSLVLNGNFSESHKILAYDLNILGRQELALHELDVAIKIDPASAESHYEIGRIYYERGSYLQSVQHLERAKALNPEFVRVYHNLGLAYSAIRENDRAAANFEEGLRRNAKQLHPSAWPLIDYGTHFNLQSNFERARDLLLESIKIEDKWDTAYNELSKAYRGLGQTSEAIEALRHAAGLNPSKAEYHYVLARLLTQTHQTEEAKLELARYQQDHDAGAFQTKTRP